MNDKDRMIAVALIASSRTYPWHTIEMYCRCQGEFSW